MVAVLKYAMDMLFCMIAVIPLYLVVRGVMIKKRGKKINWYRESVLCFFTLFVIGLLSLTVIPRFEIDMAGNFRIISTRAHGTNLIPFQVIPEIYTEVLRGNMNYFLIQFLGNIILFMPIGFVLPLLWKVSDKKVIVIGFCFSFLIEFIQLFLCRGTDIDDLILNTLGVYLGVLIYQILAKKAGKFIEKFSE